MWDDFNTDLQEEDFMSRHVLPDAPPHASMHRDSRSGKAASDHAEAVEDIHIVRTRDEDQPLWEQDADTRHRRRGNITRLPMEGRGEMI